MDENVEQPSQDGEQTEKIEEQIKINYLGTEFEIPPQYYDNEKKELNVEAVLKSNLDLRQQISNKPKAPETYNINVPDDLKDKVNINNESGLYKTVSEMGKKYGITQSDFDILSSNYMTENQGMFNSFFSEEQAKFKQALGDNYQTEVEKERSWLTSLIGDSINEDLKVEVSSLLSTAAGVNFVRLLKDKTKIMNVPSAKEVPISKELSRDDLRDLIRSNEYRSGNEDVVKKVNEGYQKLYGG